MSPKIVWRYRRKRHAPSAAGSRKQDRGFGAPESQSAGGQQMSRLEEKDRQGKLQFQEEEKEVQAKQDRKEEEEEEVQTRVQFQEQEEEEMQARLQFQEEEKEVQAKQDRKEEEEEEAQTKVQFREEKEEEMQPKVQLQEEEEEVQAKPEPVATRSARLIRSVAGSGFRGSPGGYPFQHRIQAAFGRHDITHVKAFSDAAANKANRRLGALAYTSREKVAFRGYPDLHTAAHEAAHVIQQRQGIQLKDGTGRKGDVYERHADAVAERVVKGKSAQELLNKKPESQGG